MAIVVLEDLKTALMHQSMVMAAEQHQVVQIGFSASSPVLHVMGIDEPGVGTARKPTMPISRPQGAFQSGWYRAPLATDVEWNAVAIALD